MVDRVGHSIDDYHLIRLLGTGSFGEVYLGEHLHNQTPAAVKMLNLDQENLKQFVKEASTTLRLKHPHIIRLLTFGLSPDDLPYLIMDYAPNGTFRQRHPKGLPLPLHTIVSYLLPLASALQYAHDNRVIHCDVKPDNVLIGQDGQVLLSDFGIAVIAPIERSLRTQNLGGTAPYMAPEQIRGKPQPASDQYAIGIMAYEWLCGVRPFQGTLWEILDQHRYLQPPPLREKLPDLPRMVEEIILKALAKDPAARFASVQDFATALQAASGVSPMDSQSARTSGVSDAGTVSSATASPILPGQTKEQGVAAVPPPTVVGSLEASARVPLTEKLAPATASYAETVAASPASLGTQLPSAIIEPPRGGRTVPPSPLSVVQGKKPLPSMPITPSLLPARVRLPAGRAIVLVLLVLVVVGSGGIWATLYVITHTLSPYDQFAMKNGVQFGFDAQHTGFNPYESQLSPATVSTLVQAWTATTGGSVSSPAVANGVVYVGSNDDKLYAFKADGCGQPTCSPLWAATTDDQIDSSPAVANGVVYVGSTDGKLYAFKAGGCGQSACSPLWTATTGNAISSSSPAVANGVVYVGSDDSKLYAFKAGGCGQSACSPLWTATTGSEIWSSPAVANGVVYVGSGDGKLYAFKADGCSQLTCSPLWTAAIDSQLDDSSSPVVANGVVYVGSNDDKLYAFKADGCDQPTCSPLWTAATGSAIYSSPAVANGVVYVGSDDSKLYAFKTDGCGQPMCSPLWTADDRIGSSSPAVANGVVYVDSSQLYAFKADGCDQSTCSPLWTADDRIGSSSPAVANGVVYVDSSQLYAFHRK